jgi:hypothetical protein
MNNFVLARDRTTKEIVHIKDVPEGYSNGECSECGHPLIAANKNQATRKVACYFRHDVNSSCTGSQLVHDLAVEVLVRYKEVTLPCYEKSIRFPETGDIYQETLFTLSARTHSSDDVKAEQTQTGESGIRRTDVVFFGERRLNVEVHHTNAVKEDRAEFYRKLNRDCIEVDVEGYDDCLEAGIDEFANFICHKSERRWIHLSSDTPELKSAYAELEHSHRMDLKIRAAYEVERKRGWEREREKNSHVIAKLQAFMQVGAEELRFKLNHQERYRSARIERRLKTLHGCIPEYINQEGEHDYAFKTARYRWQRLVHDYVIEHHNDILHGARQSHEPPHRFSLIDMYHMLRSEGVPVLELVDDTEAIHQGVLSEVGRNTWVERGLTEDEARAIPRPLAAINDYLRYLKSLGLVVRLKDGTFGIGVKVSEL